MFKIQAKAKGLKDLTHYMDLKYNTKVMYHKDLKDTLKDKVKITLAKPTSRTPPSPRSSTSISSHLLMARRASSDLQHPSHNMISLPRALTQIAKERHGPMDLQMRLLPMHLAPQTPQPRPRLRMVRLRTPTSA